MDFLRLSRLWYLASYALVTGITFLVALKLASGSFDIASLIVLFIRLPQIMLRMLILNPLGLSNFALQEQFHIVLPFVVFSAAAHFAIAAFRLRDMGESAWMSVLIFVPGLNYVVQLWLLVTPSDAYRVYLPISDAK